MGHASLDCIMHAASSLHWARIQGCAFEALTVARFKGQRERRASTNLQPHKTATASSARAMASYKWPMSTSRPGLISSGPRGVYCRFLALRLAVSAHGP
eukprot:scaffold273179_cov35-Tisochrysis_lutea.AAC.1